MANLKALQDGLDALNNRIDSFSINPYGIQIQQDLDLKVDTSDFQEVKTQQDLLSEVTRENSDRLNIHDQMIEDLRQQMQDALKVLTTPGLIADKALDKLLQFITKHKKTLTDKSGTTIEMISIPKLTEAIERIREVLNNGNTF